MHPLLKTNPKALRQLDGDPIILIANLFILKTRLIIQSLLQTTFFSQISLSITSTRNRLKQTLIQCRPLGNHQVQNSLRKLKIVQKKLTQP